MDAEGKMVRMDESGAKKKRLDKNGNPIEDPEAPADVAGTSAEDQGLPVAKFTRSELLPRVAISQRWDADAFKTYGNIWGCQSNFNIDKDGNKIPTSRLDFSEISKRCGQKDYEDFVNRDRYTACKNCETERFYKPRRENQEDLPRGQLQTDKNKEPGKPPQIAWKKQD